MDAWSRFYTALDENDDDKIVELVTSQEIGLDECGLEGSVVINAANFGKNELLTRLIELGADVNVAMQDSGVTALHAAASQNYPETGRILIEHGADVSARAKMAVRSQFYYSPHCSETALHLAAAYCDEEFIMLLLESGASPSVEDGIGATPVDYVRRHRHSRANWRKLKNLIENWQQDAV